MNLEFVGRTVYLWIMTGQGGNHAPALPLDEVVELVKRYRPAAPAAET